MALPPTEYQVGWICALSGELAASRAMLDEEHGRPNVQTPHDHNSYVAGRIHDCNVIMACLPAGRDGPSSAAAVAKDMIRSFPTLRFCLLVGIGGGVPNAARGFDIRLGDVVVSMPTGERGGVIQYDKGKTTNEGFIRKGALDSPPTVLLTAVSSLQAENDLNGSHITTFVTQALNKYPRLRRTGYASPAFEQDLLFESSYEHQSTARDCSGCETTYLVARSHRADTEPCVHYGLIASADTVVKSTSLRDQLANYDGALCVEMEAAGLMSHLPCLVIRGICDYADSHKNDEWQKYAAMTAAAYAKELLGHVVVSILSGEKTIGNLLDLAKEQVDISREHLAVAKEHFANQSAMYQDKDFTECHQTFKVCDYVSFKNANPDAVEGTCQWVMTHEKFVAWSENRSNTLLWISADPGCGKSVLSKTLVDTRLRQNSQSSVCYFFFKDNDEQNTLYVALCAILHQLFTSQPHLLRHALKPWKANGKSLATEPDGLWQIFLSAAADTHALPIVCLFDALDECHEKSRKILIRKLCTRWGSGPPLPATKLKFLVTSRPYDDVEHTFRQNGAPFDQMRIYGEDENAQLRREIDLVVHGRVIELAAEFHLSQQATHKLRDELLKMEHRTYLWLYLAIDHIRQLFRDSMHPNLVSIDRLPSSVEDAYEGILNRVNHQQQALVKRILLIVVGARRSLTIGEMALALQWSPKLSASSAGDISVEHLERVMRQWCGLFIFFNRAKIQLIHQTAKEFLLFRQQGMATMNSLSWKSSMEVAEVECKMAQICVAYLCSAPLPPCIFHLFTLARAIRVRLKVAEYLHAVYPEHHSLSGARSAFDPKPDRGTFFEYAATAWAEHLEFDHASDREAAWTKVIQIYSDNSSRWECLYMAMAINRWSPREQLGRSYPGGTPEHLAAMLGQTWLLRKLHPTFSESIDDFDSFGRTPLMWAASMGQIDTVKWLISMGARRELRTSVLYLAIKGNHEAVVRYLFSQGVDVNGSLYHRRHPGRPGEDSPLLIASRDGQSRMVSTCLEAGAEVDAQIRWDDSTALQAAAKHGHTEVVEILLEAGADANYCGGGWYGFTENKPPTTALQYAAANGDVKAVQLLLAHHADVHAGHIHFCRNALHAAAKAAHPAVAQLLINAGADIHAKDCCGGNAVQLLISPSGSLNPHEDPFGHFDLHDEDRRGATLDVLLQNGADLHAVGSETCANALHLAATGRSPIMVRKLIDLGMDVNSQGGKFGHALQAASMNSQVKIVEILLEAGANVNARGGVWGHALLAAVSRKIHDVSDSTNNPNKVLHQRYAASNAEHLATVECLIERGANVNLVDERWGTALHLAAYHNSFECVELLLTHGANVNINRGTYGTPLHASVQPKLSVNRRQSLLIELLIKAGADVNAYSSGTGTALDVAAATGYLDGMRLLLQHGADVNKSGTPYNDVLRAAVMSEPHERSTIEEMVQVLLDYNIDILTFGPWARQAAKQQGYKDVVMLPDRAIQAASEK